MKLMTKAIEKKLPPLYATEETPNEEKEVAIKFFTPDAGWTWYVLEGEKVELDDGTTTWEFFGYVDSPMASEYGYFVLSELESIRGPFGLPIERDRNFTAKMADILKS